MCMKILLKHVQKRKKNLPNEHVEGCNGRFVFQVKRSRAVPQDWRQNSMPQYLQVENQKLTKCYIKQT
jgi:hypothetical protein